MTTLTGTHKGRVCTVTADEKGYHYEGKTYKSLSPIATAFCKCSMNGPKFFGLRPGGAGTKRAAKEPKTDCLDCKARKQTTPCTHWQPGKKVDRMSAPSERRGKVAQEAWEAFLAKPIKGRTSGRDMEVVPYRGRRIWS